MTVHCLELLASNIPQPPLIRAIGALVFANDTNRKQTFPTEVSDKAIEYFRGRIDVPTHWLTFCTSLFFERTNSIDNYEAMALLDKSIIFKSNGDSPGPYVDHALGVSASLHGTAPACTGTQNV